MRLRVGRVGPLMAVREGRRLGPGVERLHVFPPGNHEPLFAGIGGSEQLEALETLGPVDRSGPSGKPAGKLVARAGGYRDGIDLDDRHGVRRYSLTPICRRRLYLSALAGRSGHGIA